MYRIQEDDLVTLMEFWEHAKKNPCVAPIVDPLDSGPCSGPLTLDHVHRHAGGTKGKRAASDEFHLVSLCYGHHIEARNGGSVWATSHRPHLRQYLEDIYGSEGDDRQGP